MATGTPLDLHTRQARRDRWRGRLAGLLAALAMLTVIVALRPLIDAVSLLDTLADALLLILPIEVFQWFLEIFGKQAKTLLLVGLVGGLLVLGLWLGGMFARQTAGSRRFKWPQASVYGAVIFLCTAGFVVLFVNDRMPNALSGSRFPLTMLTLAAAAVAFALVMAAVLMLLRRGDPAPDVAVAAADAPTADRRRVLTWAGLGAAALAGLIVVGRDVQRVAGRKTVATGATGELPPAITPNDDFYVISKNFVDPNPDRGPDWSVAIDGLVDEEVTLSRADLEAMGNASFVSTLTCISNPIGGDLISTAEWTGVPLVKVLERVGVKDTAIKAIFEGEDGYTDSIPVERLMRPEPHLVWAMNGEPLPRLHGTPVRLIVPGLYGIKNIKWLTKITLTDEDYQGYWQQRGWTDEGVVKTSSRIDVPGDRSVVEPGLVEIGGIAFAGDRGVSKVEVSTDDGETWRAATIRDNPSPDGLSWVIWTMPWQASSGTYTLAVRATDGAGEMQTSERVGELPDGASGWHRIRVVVT
jgi:DMSO/TMAO reductase YedYZ molybdopterin-dependent catalytic subunit